MCRTCDHISLLQTKEICRFLGMGERMSEGGQASGEQGASGEQEGIAAGNHVDRELQAILEGTAGDARFLEPTADDRGKLAKQAQKRREADAKKLAKLHS